MPTNAIHRNCKLHLLMVNVELLPPKRVHPPRFFARRSDWLERVFYLRNDDVANTGRHIRPIKLLHRFRMESARTSLSLSHHDLVLPCLLLFIQTVKHPRHPVVPTRRSVLMPS
jgi:hypothetical protein